MTAAATAFFGKYVLCGNRFNATKSSFDSTVNNSRLLIKRAAVAFTVDVYLIQSLEFL